MMVFWGVAIIIGGVLVARYFKREDRTGTIRPGQSESAVEILERRYAKGELSREEYLEMVAVLKNQTGSE
jgi:uncharacterized membrane protein